MHRKYYDVFTILLFFEVLYYYLIMHGFGSISFNSALPLPISYNLSLYPWLSVVHFDIHFFENRVDC